MSEPTPTMAPSRSLALVVVVAAAAVLGLLSVPLGPTPVLVGVLTAGLFGTALTLGTGIAIAACVLTGARWWLPVRPLAARIAALLPVPLLLLAAVLALGRGQLFTWTSESVMVASPLLQEKAAWLNEPFFLFRGAIVLLAWWGLTVWLVAALRRAIEDPDPASRRRLVRASIAFVLLLGPTLSVASWDWAMSLEPAWFSTMYGVYLFSGFFLAGLATLAALASFPGGLPGIGEFPASVRHDLGKLVFAFASFWAYIWYCQYMLIWYANLPEEATYYTLRLNPEWSTLFWLVPLLSFVVPFIVLMPAGAKRRRSTLLQVSLVVLVGRWLDLYVMVAPPTGAGRGTSPLAAAVGLALVVGLFVTLRRAVAPEAGRPPARPIASTSTPRWSPGEPG